ncbi:unnamed protein product [Ranitomeya imitator]|uniref:Uncharacterized protein n=1 Tax=Ranitomeya imitator TaxID=111125 RepID=A0ABN9MAK6_9NEOB|nr:unnamed protein product [Ranitomeya imitator]
MGPWQEQAGSTDGQKSTDKYEQMGTDRSNVKEIPNSSWTNSPTISPKQKKAAQTNLCIREVDHKMTVQEESREAERSAGGQTAVDGDGAQALINHSSPGQVKVIRLDVTSDEEVEKVKQYVKENLPDKGLWGLVNNAGISMWGMVEWLTIDKYQKVLNVNLLGSIRTTLAFAPLIRKNKGRMVFLSSTNAYISMLNSIYSMSKAGLEKFCDCLRLEMKKFGVQVCIIEPGNYAPATNIQPFVDAEQIWDPLSAEVKEICSKESIERITNFVREQLESGSRKSHEVVDAIIDALTSPSPKPRYLVARLVEQLTLYLYLWLPTSLFDQFLLFAVRKSGWS